MFISLVIASLDDLARVRFILLLRSIGKQTHVIMNVEIKQRTRFTSGFVDDKLVKCIVLLKTSTPEEHAYHGGYLHVV